VQQLQGGPVCCWEVGRDEKDRFAVNGRTKSRTGPVDLDIARPIVYTMVND